MFVFHEMHQKTDHYCSCNMKSSGKRRRNTDRAAELLQKNIQLRLQEKENTFNLCDQKEYGPLCAELVYKLKSGFI